MQQPAGGLALQQCNQASASSNKTDWDADKLLLCEAVAI